MKMALKPGTAYRHGFGNLFEVASLNFGNLRAGYFVFAQM